MFTFAQLKTNWRAVVGKLAYVGYYGGVNSWFIGGRGLSYCAEDVVCVGQNKQVFVLGTHLNNYGWIDSKITIVSWKVFKITLI